MNTLEKRIVPENELRQNDSPILSRVLKIEEHGDPWKGIKPKIRLVGRWLERAGFIPGRHVQVTCVSPGIIELRSHAVSIVDLAKELPTERQGEKSSDS